MKTIIILLIIFCLVYALCYKSDILGGIEEIRKIWSDNVENGTLANDNYRKVESTTDNMQFVYMSLKPGQEIGKEKHKLATQFIKVESGIGVAEIDGQQYKLEHGVAVMVPPDTWHNIINTGNEKMKLYTIYTPPEHQKFLIQQEKPFTNDL